MSFFISDANAALSVGGGPQDNGLGSILLIVLMFVAFYFLLWRPQQKRTKEHHALVSNLAKGVEVKLQKQAIGSVMPKGTLKNI